MRSSLVLLAVITLAAQSFTPTTAQYLLNIVDGSGTNNLGGISQYLQKRYTDPDTLENSIVPGGLPNGYAYCYTGTVNATQIADICQALVNQTSLLYPSALTYAFTTQIPDPNLPWASYFVATGATGIPLTGDNNTLSQCTSFLTNPTKPIKITFTLDEQTNITALQDKLVVISSGGATVDLFTQRSYTDSTYWEFTPIVSSTGVLTGAALPTDPSSSAAFRVGKSDHDQDNDCTQKNQYKYLHIQRQIRGFDITGVTNEVDIQNLPNFCACAQMCYNNPDTCVTWVYKFNTPQQGMSGKRQCTIYSNLNNPAATTFTFADVTPHNPPSPQLGIPLADANAQTTPQAGAPAPQCTQDGTNGNDPLCASGISYRLQNGQFAL